MSATRNVIKKKKRNGITFYICVHRIGLVFDYFDGYITQEKHICFEIGLLVRSFIYNFMYIIS